MKVLHRQRVMEGFESNAPARAHTSAKAGVEAGVRPEASRELFDSLLLFGLAATSLGAYVGIAFAAVRMLGTR